MNKYFNWRNLAIVAVATASFVMAAPNMAVADGNEPAPAAAAEVSNIEIPADTLQEMENDAEAGNAEAQVTVGAIYYSGNGAKKDYAKSKHYLEMAANQGNTDAMVILSGIYAQGLGVDQDVEKAINLLVEAAQKGNENAQEALKVLNSIVDEEENGDNGDGDNADNAADEGN